LTTKIHALVDALGNPADLMLTAGQIHDLACAQDLIKNADPQALIADKAYDADPLIDSLAQREITPVIPPKSNRKTKRDCDFALYRERNLIERFFNKIKHFRAIATRYDKLARNFPRSRPTGLGYHPSQMRTGSRVQTQLGYIQ
jgi:transposase